MGLNTYASLCDWAWQL